MRRIFVLLILTHSFFFSPAQTTDEWLRQKETQKKYLLQQLAALQSFFTVAKKGYNVAKVGLGAVGDIKNGDFGLHSDYFESLRKVNWALAGSAMVGEIFSIEVRIVKEAKATLVGIRSSGQMTAEEISWSERVIARLLAECATVMDELTDVTTDGTFSMKDEERLERTQKLYAQAVDDWKFVAGFSEEMGRLVKGRLAGKVEVERERRWR
jgi:hypothetical protein